MLVGIVRGDGDSGDGSGDGGGESSSGSSGDNSDGSSGESSGRNDSNGSSGNSAGGDSSGGGSGDSLRSGNDSENSAGDGSSGSSGNTSDGSSGNTSEGSSESNPDAESTSEAGDVSRDDAGGGSGGSAGSEPQSSRSGNADAGGSGQDSGSNQSPPLVTVTIANVPVVVGPTDVVFNGETVAVEMSSFAVVADGQTFTVNLSQVIAAGTTVAVPQAPAPSPPVSGETSGAAPPALSAPSPLVPAAPTLVTAQDVTFAVGPSQAIFSDNTFAVGPNVAPTTAIVHAQTISLGPQGVRFASTTVPIPDVNNSAPVASSVAAATVSGVGFAVTTVAGPRNVAGLTFSTLTAGDLAIAVNPTAVVVSSQTYRIGAGAAPTTVVVVGSETISLGPEGLELADITIAPLAPSATGIQSAVTAGGLTFAINLTEDLIGDATYRIGGRRLCKGAS